MAPISFIWISVWGHSTKKYTKQLFILQKRAIKYSASLIQTDSCQENFVGLKLLTLYSVSVQETILYVKEKGRL
jgi:hypothetical protein